MKKHLFLLGLCIGFAVTALGAEGVKVNVSKLPPAASKAGLTFDKDIKPIFEKSCAKCHGPEVEKPKGKFRSDTHANVMKGGAEGPAVTAGDITKSPLLAMIAYVTDDEELYMPPKENKAKIAPLSKDEVSLVRAWIEQGAK